MLWEYPRWLWNQPKLWWLSDGMDQYSIIMEEKLHCRCRMDILEIYCLSHTWRAYGNDVALQDDNDSLHWAAAIRNFLEADMVVQYLTVACVLSCNEPYWECLRCLSRVIYSKDKFLQDGDNHPQEFIQELKCNALPTDSTNEDMVDSPGLQITLASSVCPQLCDPTPRCEHNSIDDSLPVQETSSSKICPVPWPNRALPGADIGDPKPRCLQTTRASVVLQESSHTVPHTLLILTSTRPSRGLLPPTSRTFQFPVDVGIARNIYISRHLDTYFIDDTAMHEFMETLYYATISNVPENW